MEIVGVDHLYLSVSDFARSLAFYDAVMQALGFFKGDRTIGGDPHAHYFNRALQLSIRPRECRLRTTPTRRACTTSACRRRIAGRWTRLTRLSWPWGSKRPPLGSIPSTRTTT